MNAGARTGSSVFLTLRIEKTQVTTKRNLRVLKWIGTAPAVGLCTQCDRQFTVPVAALKRAADAQQSLTAQFDEHDCDQESSNG